MAENLLSVNEIKSAIRRSNDGNEEWLPDSTSRGGGRLLLRAKNGRGSWHFRYTKAKGQRDTLSIGGFAATRTKDDPSGGAFTLAEARARTLELGALLKDPASRDVRAYLAAQELALQAKQEAEALKPVGTLLQLMEAYANYLEVQQKPSAYSVRNLTKNHISKAWPDLAEKPATEVSRRDVMQIIRCAQGKGHARVPGLVKSNIRAAYAVALNVETNPDIPELFGQFGIESNPAADLKVVQRDKGQSVALSSAELGLFLDRLARHQTIHARLVEQCVWGGGQRPTQMGRACIGDFLIDHKALRLLDPKGNREIAREHLVPFGAEGSVQLQLLISRARATGTKFLFSAAASGPCDVSAASKACTEISRSMVKEGLVSTPFVMRDIRRTCETLLAAKGVSKDMRAQVTSHGLGGIQDQRYDRYDYLKEKREVLEMWDNYISSLYSRRRRPKTWHSLAA